jgi:putative transposase
VKVTVHRQVQGRVKTIQVRRDGRRWMLVLSCDQVPTRPLEPTGATVGIDVGIVSFATTSDGQQVPNPGYGQVVANHGLLVVEDLRISNMVRRPAPRPDPDQPGGFLPNRAAAKTGLHRSIHDAGWAQFVSILRAKAEEAGRVVIDVNADEHAARNILRAGLARLAVTQAV